MAYKLRWPNTATITGRSSTMRGQFIRSIIPSIEPTEEEKTECLARLEQDPDNLHCAYCGQPATEWDHLRPFVREKKHSGYITDIYNLVPACGKCNQSKGGKEWEAWMRGSARLSPVKGPEHERRVEILLSFDEWSKERTYRMALDENENSEHAQYMKRCDELIESLHHYQVLALQIRTKLEEEVKMRRASHQHTAVQ